MKSLETHTHPYSMTIVIALTIIIVVLAHWTYKDNAFAYNAFTLFKESMSTMSEPPKIVLFGDSILNNTRYVPSGKSVIAHLKHMYGDNLQTYAQDGAYISNVYGQVEQYENYGSTSGSDSTRTHIIISVGGNDLLNEMNIGELNDSKVTYLSSKYERLLKYICGKYPNAVIHLLNVYQPTHEIFISASKQIEQWNNEVYNRATESVASGRKKKQVVNVVKIDEVCVEKSDFVNTIEPSVKGGKKIVSLIVENVNEYY